MDGGVSFYRLGGVVFVLVVLAVGPLATIASADQPLPRSYLAPIPTPTFGPPNYALPYAVPKFDFGPVNTGKFVKEIPELSFDTLDLGKSALRLDVADAAYQAAPGTPDLTNVIVPLPPGKKRGTRRYFGLTLTTPTQ